MVDMGWNVWARENRRVKEEYMNRTPPTGGSGVTQDKPWWGIKEYSEALKHQNTFYTEVVKCGDALPQPSVTYKWTDKIGEITDTLELSTPGIKEMIELLNSINKQPIQILPEPLKYEPGWKDRCDELEEQVTNLQEWCQELVSEIEVLKREKLDKYSKETILC